MANETHGIPVAVDGEQTVPEARLTNAELVFGEDDDEAPAVCSHCGEAHDPDARDGIAEDLS